MKKNLQMLLIIIFLLSNADLFAQTYSRKISVPLYASVQESPPKITLKWAPQANNTGYKIYKKPKEAISWGIAIATLPATDTIYIDNNVIYGQSYEYRINEYDGADYGYGYIWAGIMLPEIQQKGILILLVDNNYISALSAEIKQLEQDIIGDGWQIIRHNIDRTQTDVSIRNLIINDYNTHQNVNAVFLLGRITVPYSGLFTYSNYAPPAPPDGHVGSHNGAWPCDAFYGDINGTFTDVDTEFTGCNRVESQNRIGDGKWDQIIIPSDVELEVGRVDLYNMGAFSKNDTLLVKKYLIKDHDFKTGKITAEPRSLIDDNFTATGYFLAPQAWRGFSTMFGPQNINSTGDYFTEMHKSSYLWSCGAGAGSFTSCNGIGTSSSFVQDSLANIFTMLSGSYFGDWDNANNLLRAPLASKGTTLVSFWGGIPNWPIHHMALGENIGYCARLTMNNNQTYNGNFNGSQREVHIALMGDPTLRMHVVKPVKNLVLTSKNSKKNVSLTWNSPNDSIIGYNIYRSESFYSHYSKVNPSIITDSFYLDSFPYNGNNVYLVRAVKIQRSASGSYLNMSIGIMDSVDAVNSINESIAAIIDLNIFPNPNQGKFNVSIETSKNADLNCEVINPLGKVIYNDHYQISSGSATKTIDLGNVEKGMYILKINGKNTFVTKQLIIQ